MATTQREYWPTQAWREAAPETQGMNRAMLEQASAYSQEHYPHMHSLLVVRGGVLVWERYYGGQDRDLRMTVVDGQVIFDRGDPYPTGYDHTQVNCVKSVTKSFTSALTGIALRQGLIRSIDQRVEEFFPEYFTDDLDPRVRQLTLRHLLMMRSGFAWAENDQVTWDWGQAIDKVKFALNLPLVAAPGERWNYSTADTHILGAVLTKAAGMSLLEYGDQVLFGPLGFAPHRWTQELGGYCYGGSELFLTPRDMAKFGYLYLNDGRWGDQQIVPAEWVAESIAPQPDVDGDVITAAMPNLTSIPYPPDMRYYREGYGYLWWRTSYHDYPVYFAAGYGGQLICVIDDLDLVVVQTASTDISPQDFTPERTQSGHLLMEKYIVPAAQP